MVLVPALLCSMGWFVSGTEARRPERIVIEPGATLLRDSRDTAQCIATGYYPGGELGDLTDQVAWSVHDPAVALIGPSGVVRGVADGRTEAIARLGELEARCTIEVRGARERRPIAFASEVLPALTKATCNQGACHGTPTGKNGFRLSLRGFDPALDFRSLAREVGARRCDPIDPESSLLLLKGTGRVPHEGGPRMVVGSELYATVRDWIAEGLHADAPAAPRPVGLEVWPRERVLDAPACGQQLVARATFSDGATRDVTQLARFTSTDESTATVSGPGRVVRARRGEATILVSYAQFVATARLVFREPVPGLVWVDPPENNFIDRHLFARLKLLGIPPSELSDDAMFCRRVHLDVTGLPPQPEAVVAFLEDGRPDKRERLIDALLDRPEYAEFWALKWADRLGCNQRFTGQKGAYSYYRWIHDQIAANVPFDRFVRAIVTAKGANYTNPPASFYRRVRGPEDAVETVSQLFLGVRLQCARCHNHVAERWTQDDYYGMAAFFGQITYKNGPRNYAQYNKEETVIVTGRGEVVQPRTGTVMKPTPLGSAPAAIETGADRREALADWLVAPSNPFFAKAAVNRIWYHLFGRGIVDPVDDLRESNPPVAPELLDALASDFINHGYDVKHTIRTILRSRAYQLSSRTNPFNAADTRYFSHALVRLLSAEQVLDAASLATAVPERFFHLPRGTRAAQLPDGEFVHPFLRAFGQPQRSEACECERQSDSTLDQALQLVGGRSFHAKVVARDNRIGRLLESGAVDARIIESLFLACLGRRPNARERGLAEGELAARGADRRAAAEDLLWSLLNHPEFLFQH